MDTNKMKYIKQNEAKVYICTFQLDLIQLRIFLRFPCKFLVEWKTTNNHQCTRTLGAVQYKDGVASFNQKLTLQVQMIHDDNKNSWIRKDSSINVYLITKSKPDFNQLAGRLNIDLSQVCSNNPYKKPTVQSLTYTSTNADLKFILDLKYSIKSKKEISQIDLLSFNDRLYLVKNHLNNNDSLSKSKSVDYLKNSKNIISPVYQLIQNDKDNRKNSKQGKFQTVPMHFPLSKLQSFGHQALQVQNLQPQFQQQMRMTLGGQRKFSKIEYDQLIQQQTLGMKKSNLIFIPDMKKSHIQQDDSQIQTNTQKRSQHVSQQDFVIDLSKNSPSKQKQKNMGMKKISSQNTKLKRSKSPQSDIDIVVQLDSKPSILPDNQKKTLKNSMNSSNSFSISKFNAKYEAMSQQESNKIKSQKNSITSVQFHAGFEQFAQFSNDQMQQQNLKLRAQCQNGKNRIRQLQSDISELVKMLTDARQISEQQRKQRSQTQKRLKVIENENKSIKAKLSQYEQKYNYESKINEINCQKLKTVNSQLTLERKRSQSLLSTQDPKIRQQLITSKSKLSSLQDEIKKLQFQKYSLQQKIYKRDQIQLQNEIKIQQLEEQLLKYRTQKLNNAPKTTPSYLGIQSTIKHENKSSITKKQKSKLQFSNNQSPKNEQLYKSGHQKAKLQQQKQKLSEYIKFLQEKLSKFEQSNLQFKQKQIEDQKIIQFYLKRDQRMKQNLSNIQNEFRSVALQLIQRQKQLKQKENQTEMFNKKSNLKILQASKSTSNAKNTQNPNNNNTKTLTKLKQCEEQLKKKQQLLNFCESQIHLLQQELYKFQKQIKQLQQINKKLISQSAKYEGDLKVIKQQQSYRQSLASSVQVFLSKSNANPSLTLLEINIIQLYKQAVDDYYLKKQSHHQSIQLQIKIQLNHLRNKFFQQLSRATQIINALYIDNQILQRQKVQIKEQKQKNQYNLQLKIHELQNKIQLIQQNQRVSAGSTLTQTQGNHFLKPVQQKIDRYSQSTKKRTLISSNSQSQLNREIQKLKSIIYDKNKQMSDLIVSYEKLKLQKQTQSMLIKNKGVMIGPTTITNIDEDYAQQHLVHDILDLQIRLNKQKSQKYQIMQELQVRKSLNRSQQVSQYVQQTNNFDLIQIYKQISSIIQKRQSFISQEKQLNQLVNKVNSLQQNLQKVDKDYKLIHQVQQKSRAISRQMQKIKSSILKMTIKDIQTTQYKNKFMTILKPCQNSISELLISVENMVNFFV